MVTKKTISLFLYSPETRQVVLSVRRAGQHFSGYLQATCHGAIEAGEDHADAIERELKEETGLDLIDIGSLEFLGELDAGATRDESCSYYLASIDDAGRAKLRATPEVERFEVIGSADLPSITQHSALDKKTKPPRTMFDDELEALTMALGIVNE